MNEFDEDESGEIEFSEFIELAEHFVEPEQDPKEYQKDLREVFVFYDKQKKGYIPTADFKDILKELGPDVPESELDGIVDEIDQDSSGTIDFAGEFSNTRVTIFLEGKFTKYKGSFWLF